MDSRIRGYALIDCFLAAGALAMLSIMLCSFAADSNSLPPELATVNLWTNGLAIGLPLTVYLGVGIAAGIGLQRRSVWGYYLHLAFLCLTALSCVGIAYTLIGFVHARQDKFRDRFEVWAKSQIAAGGAQQEKDRVNSTI